MGELGDFMGGKMRGWNVFQNLNEFNLAILIKNPTLLRLMLSKGGISLTARSRR